MQTYALLFHMCLCYTSDAYVKYSFSMYLNVICSFQFYPTSSHPLNEVNSVVIGRGVICLSTYARRIGVAEQQLYLTNNKLLYLTYSDLF